MARTVIHLIGQSNACGRVDLPSGLVTDWLLPDGSVISDANPAPNDVSISYGVEMFAAQCYQPGHPVFVVKTCRGGGAAGSGSAGFILDMMMQTHFQQSLALDTAIIDCTECAVEHKALWVQGEYEALRNPDYQTYQQDEAAVFNALIDNHPDIRICSVLLNESINRPFTEEINASKIANALSFPQVETIGPFTVGTDGLHYDEQGLQEMASAFCGVI